MRDTCGVIAANVALLLNLSINTFAQGGAALRGTVTDSTGALIPGADVTATNDTTAISVRQVPNEVGNFEFSGLQPGLYTLTAEAADFQTGIHSNVELRAGQRILLNFRLEVVVVDTIVVIGSRARPRSVTESTVPIDVISTEEIVSHAFTEMETFFRTMIEEGQAQGEIGEEVSATDAARALLGLIIGLRVLARSRPEGPLLRSIENQAETLLG